MNFWSNKGKLLGNSPNDIIFRNYDSKKVDQDEDFYYLTIRLQARDFYEMMVDEREANQLFSHTNRERASN